MIIRPVTYSDAEGIIGIYSHYVKNTAVTFEYEVPAVNEMAARIAHYTEKYPWLVAEDQSGIVGYAYASTYRERAAYQWCCESSVYVQDVAKGKGVAFLLYEQLMSELTQQGLRNVYGVITTPNPESEKFHAKCGFESFAIFKNVGYKLGRWHDVLWMVKYLNPHTSMEPNKN